MRFEALPGVFEELFGSRLTFGVVGDREVVLLWHGEVDTTALLAEGGPELVAEQFLSTAHDIWLRGLGEEGTHPGPWANARPEVVREGDHLRLRPIVGEDEVAAALVSLA